MLYHCHYWTNDIILTWGLLFPSNPMVTTVSTVVAPKLVLAAISPPFSVFVNQNWTHEQHTNNVRGMYIYDIKEIMCFVVLTGIINDYLLTIRLF